MFVFLCRPSGSWLCKDSTYHILVLSSLCSLVAPMLRFAQLPSVLGSWWFHTKFLMLHINQCNSLDANSRTWTSDLAGDRLVNCNTYFWCGNINVAETRTLVCYHFSQNHIWSTRLSVFLKKPRCLQLSLLVRWPGHATLQQAQLV